MNEYLEQAISEVNNLNEGEEFLVRDLFKGYTWNRMTVGTKLSLDNIRHSLVITNITNNGSANDVKQVYDSISKCRLAIAIKLKSIVRYINESLDNHERNEITDDNTTNETNDDLLL